LPELKSDAQIQSHDASTNGLINTIKSLGLPRGKRLKVEG
jgi:hypothetical protein